MFTLKNPFKANQNSFNRQHIGVWKGEGFWIRVTCFGIPDSIAKLAEVTEHSWISVSAFAKQELLLKILSEGKTNDRLMCVNYLIHNWSSTWGS